MKKKKRKKKKKREKKRKRKKGKHKKMSSTKVDLKVIVLGKESIGKTCLVHRYLYGRYKFQSSVILLVFVLFHFNPFFVLDGWCGFWV